MTRLTIRPVGPGDREALTRLAEDFHAEDGHVLDSGGRRALAAIAAGEPLARATAGDDDVGRCADGVGAGGLVRYLPG